MNYRMTARLIAIVLRFVALFMLPALVISLILGETGAVFGMDAQNSLRIIRAGNFPTRPLIGKNGFLQCFVDGNETDTE